MPKILQAVIQFGFLINLTVIFYNSISYIFGKSCLPGRPTGNNGK